MIRKANIKDKYGLIELMEFSVEFHQQFDSEFYSLDENTKDYIENFIEEVLKGEKNDTIFVKTDEDNNILGYIHIFEHNNEGGTTLEIRGIYVRENDRKKGIGKELFSYVENNYRKEKKNIILNVDINNQTAIDFYSSLGFKGTRLGMTKKIE